MKYLIVFFLLVVLALFFVRIYTSSPGFVTPETAQEFEQTKQNCMGLSILLNAEEMAADAPGRSLCIGLLK